MSPDSKIVHVLRRLYNLEVMATEIYRTQQGVFSDKDEEILMKKAVDNEMHHRESFRRHLMERGAGPTMSRHLFWLAGQVLGRTTSLFGRKVVLKADAAFEDKAFHDYGEFMEKANFNYEEKASLESFRNDEQRHMENWRSLIKNSAQPN